MLEPMNRQTNQSLCEAAAKRPGAAFHAPLHCGVYHVQGGGAFSVLRLLVLVLIIIGWGFTPRAEASIINEPMTGATAPGWVIGGSAYLTASSGVDAPGDGWLRLTQPLNNQAGYGFLNTPFDISAGVVIQFDYATWGGNGADGYSVYLFDAIYDATSFSPGASGGSLGYDKKTTAPLDPGLTGGYIGVGVDEYGNYSNQTEGRVDIAPLGACSGFFPNEVGVRGPATNSYDWLGGSCTLGQALGFNGLGYRPIQTGVQYRKVVIYLTPQSAPNYLRVDVYVQFGYNQPLTAVVTGLMTGQPIPASVKIGYAASTGGSTNYHEIRNLVVDSLSTDINLAMVKTSSVATVAAGGALGYTLTARNYGPNIVTATNAPITDTFPAWLTGVTWTCVGSGGATCGAASGSGNINTTATLPFNTSVTYTVSSTVNPATPLGTQLVNTATITAPAGITDYNLNDNNSTATVSVTGAPVSVSGMVYSDSGAGGGVAHNGIKDGTEGSTAVANIYAKLYRSSNLTTALQAVLIPTAAGTFTFAGVPSYDNYTIILSTNNTLTDPTPAFPSANWIYTAPLNYTLSNIAVGGVNVTNQNLGVYLGSRISGMILKDDGFNGALSNANDGILNGGGAGIPGVAVSLRNNTGATIYDTTTSGGDGRFVLFTNIASATLRIYETNLAGYISVSSNPGTTAGTYTIAGEYIQFAYVLYTDYTDVIFGDVVLNTFTPTPLASSGSATAPVWYAHTFTQGSGGTVAFTTFSRTQGTWPAVAYFQDVNCNGVYDGGDIAMPASITAVVGTQTCVLVQENILTSAANGATDAIVTRATFTYINSVGPIVVTHDVTDTTTVIAPDLTTSTKTWVDLNAGDQDPGDVIEYTITLTETAGNPASGVSVTDTLPAALTSPTMVTCPAGATCIFAGQTLTVTNISIPAYGSVVVVLDATIAAGTTVGALIDNTANVTNPVAAPTIVVSASAIPISGNKPLYLYGGAASPYQMSRTVTPGAPTTAAIAAGGGVALWNGNNPAALRLNDQITAASVALYINGSSNNARNVEVRLYCSSNAAAYAYWGPANLPTNPPVPPALPTAYNFNLTLLAGGFAFPATCNAGNYWVLQVFNRTATAGRTITVVPVSGVNHSLVNLSSNNVINITSVTPYSVVYPWVTSPASYNGGQTVYLRALVSDPFGSFDITSATITIKDSNSTTVVNGAAMTQVADSGLATKTYEYTYAIPAPGPGGWWTATVTAKEGTENTVSDFGVGTFQVSLMPSLTVIKSAQAVYDPVIGTSPNAKAIPGAEMLYTITVINSGAGAATNVVITDPLPANTKLYVGDMSGAGTGPVWFQNGAFVSGLSYTFGGLGDGADSLIFYNSGGAPITPVPDADVCDVNVKKIVANLGGTFNAASGGNNPSFSLKFKLKVN